MSMEPAKFAIGDTVFYAEANAYAQTDAACPVCFGNLSVDIILGNGERQPVACDFCERGWDGPQGTRKVTAPYSVVHESVVKGIRIDGDEWEYEVGYHDRKKEADLFRTREEAEARRVVLLAEATVRAEEMRDSHAAHGKKSLTWKVGYYRRQLEQARRDVAFYERKLSAAKVAKGAEAKP